MKRTKYTIKKWKNIKPHSNKSRKNVKTKYGNKCFLDAKRMKYPICNKYTGKPECSGLRAADYYLNLNIGKIINRKKRDKTMTKNKKTINKKLGKYYKLKNKSNKLKKKYCN